MKISFPLSGDADNTKCQLENWNCLTRLGYTLIVIKPEIMPSGTKARKFIFQNNEANRAIEVLEFFLTGIGLVSVENLSIDNDSFFIKDWLDYHAADLPEELSREKYLKLKYSTKDTGIGPVLNFLEKLFLGPLKPILIGETWENIPWDDTYK